MLDELNAAREQTCVAPDVSSASRATVGGMMANNSSGARSVLYGKTIDHVIEQRVVLSDGSVVTFGPLDRLRANAAMTGNSIEARVSNDSELARKHADAIAPLSKSAAPRRRINLDAFVDRSSRWT